MSNEAFLFEMRYKAYRDKITNLVAVRLLILSQQDRYVIRLRIVQIRLRD